MYSKSLSNEVAFRTAPQLTGPWSSEAQLFVADPGDGGGVVYDAHVHPELSEQGDSVQYVTYSRGNGTVFGDECSGEGRLPVMRSEAEALPLISCPPLDRARVLQLENPSLQLRRRAYVCPPDVVGSVSGEGSEVTQGWRVSRRFVLA